jgi:hypothetical protein
MSKALGSAELHSLAIQKIRDGELPCRKPEHVWAGSSTGASCALCDEQIQGATVEFEVELKRPHAVITFDQECFKVWEAECSRA